MSHTIEISDDDDSFEMDSRLLDYTNNEKKEPIHEISSDEDDIQEMKAKRRAHIQRLFPKSNLQNHCVNINKPGSSSRNHFPKSNYKQNVSASSSITFQTAEKSKIYEKMIGGVKVQLPVEPYGCQTALMFKVITAINKSQNCLLESPTGSGKTLALLCAALAWQKHEKDRIAQENSKIYMSSHPELNQLPGAAEYISSPVKQAPESPEMFFSKPVHSEKSIYDDLTDLPDASRIVKRPEPMQISEDSSGDGLVTIHKRRKLNSSDLSEGLQAIPSDAPLTPEKTAKTSDPQTPQQVSLPIIYYGARTHKQLQQVIKEFKRTVYCGQSTMTILSSRDNSCIREFDRSQWSSRNDMCRECIKKVKKNNEKLESETNCKYYDNRRALNHKVLPPAFDLKDLVAAGEELVACPYFGARDMAAAANVVFCPYNYLIEPGIRNSMQIDLLNNIVIIDEGHNIEDICRDAASFAFTKELVQTALHELEKAAGYRFSDSTGCLDYLIKVLQNWNQWFQNQIPLVSDKPVNNGEAVYAWEVHHFVQTLHNHNIGMEQYNTFKQHAEMFCRRLREDSFKLHGVTQVTGNLIESLDTTLGYLFRECGKYMDDFKPILVRIVSNAQNSSATFWRSSNFKKSIDKESLELRLVCMNPGVVFSALQLSRCIVLASGTLTPMASLHSELATDFPLKISTKHVIPSDRVWIGTLYQDKAGGSLDCTSKNTALSSVQDALGQALARVAAVTPSGVLVFLPSYRLMTTLAARWQETGLWKELEELKHIFMENRNARDHDDTMEDYYKYVETDKGAMLLAVYRGKVSEGMDFRDHQARAVVAIGVPFPNTFDIAVKEKMNYNNKYAKERNLLSGNEWYRVQAFRALNQALGRCVRHRGDWGAVLLLDARYCSAHYTDHLSHWVRTYLGNNHHTYASLVNSPNSLEAFMKNMTLKDKESL